MVIVTSGDFDEAEKICFGLLSGSCESAFCHANVWDSKRGTGHRQYS